MKETSAVIRYGEFCAVPAEKFEPSCVVAVLCERRLVQRSRCKAREEMLCELLIEEYELFHTRIRWIEWFFVGKS